MTAEKLAAAIHEVTTSETLSKNAEALGEQIRCEDGVAHVVAIIERSRDNL